MSTIESYGTGVPAASSSGKGTINNPYTVDEFDSMCDAGTWTGGYVEGMGYVGSNTEVTSSWNYSLFDLWYDSWTDPFGSLSDPWGNDNGDPFSEGGGGRSGGGGTGGSNGGGSGGSSGGGNSTGNNTSAPIDIDFAKLIWHQYIPSESDKVCKDFFPNDVPKQFSQKDCFTTALANAQLLDKPDMTKSQYNDNRQNIMRLFQEIFDRPIDDSGIYTSEIEQYASMFGLEVNSTDNVVVFINLGEYLLGCINYPENENIKHVVLIVGYEIGNPTNFLCMDSFLPNSQYGFYTYYDKSRFDLIYRFK